MSSKRANDEAQPPHTATISQHTQTKKGADIVPPDEGTKDCNGANRNPAVLFFRGLGTPWVYAWSQVAGTGGTQQAMSWFWKGNLNSASKCDI